MKFLLLLSWVTVALLATVDGAPVRPQPKPFGLTGSRPAGNPLSARSITNSTSNPSRYARRDLLDARAELISKRAASVASYEKRVASLSTTILRRHDEDDDCEADPPAPTTPGDDAPCDDEPNTGTGSGSSNGGDDEPCDDEPGSTPGSNDGDEEPCDDEPGTGDGSSNGDDEPCDDEPGSNGGDEEPCDDEPGSTTPESGDGDEDCDDDGGNSDDPDPGNDDDCVPPDPQDPEDENECEEGDPDCECTDVPDTTTPPAPPANEPPSAPTGGSSGDCNKMYKVKSGQNCYSVSDANGISLSKFMGMNPQIDSDCQNLYADQEYCVG